MKSPEYEQWKILAWETILMMASTKQKFSADTITGLIEWPDASHPPNSVNSVIGYLFQQAEAAHYISQCGYIRSKSFTRKGGVIREWQGI